MSEHRLGEIVIERPRGGSRCSSRRLKGVKKELDRITKEATEDGLLSPYLIKVKDKSKDLSDHLGPLRRLLRSKVGQPWDQVYSELCQQLKPNTLTGLHVISHLWDYVVLHVEMIDGVPYHKASASHRRYGPLGSYYQDNYFVHPETRILCLAPKVTNFNKKPKKPDDLIWIDDYHQYRKIDDIWYVITFKDFTPYLVVTDVVLKVPMTSKIAYDEYKKQIYAAHKRQCSKRELKLIQVRRDE
ncbi:hypothetical protein C7H19_05775 [Aphanothece hegewaldii CCALA 016]|uniref:Uncharacterized protein n=1 Tax=Aphanothece hegewaldii CCALA 016 TaxID=2107694 RepID=A0A2T1M1D9_9CHRO|nr:hypothetical protein [Aphanothece hegewaldii]PSF38492.1 hypothetical protein C7H19_05775 [Aphanothece hegewaldii CCALA 016]